MSCLPCFQKDEDEEDGTDNQPVRVRKETHAQTDASSSNAKSFNFRELAMATKNFRQECLLGEGGFGRVFKGTLQATGQVVAVKQLDRNGMQGNKEFLAEIMTLSLIQHPNLISLIGYCADGDQRLLVYEYLHKGNLERHLFCDTPDKKPMDWFTRMKIASGAAQGLEYLHEKSNPPIIYRDLKPSNILLDDNFEPKLSDYGLAKLGAEGGKMNPTSRVMDTYGYSAPEYSSSGELTLKSDIYSFGVVLLELITGRRGVDTTRPNDEQNLVSWAQPIFREPKRFPDLADPRLHNEFPVTCLNQAVGICAMCLQEEPAVRPIISDVVAALSFLSIPQPITNPASTQTVKEVSPADHSPPPQQKMEYRNEATQDQPSHDDSSSDESETEGSNQESVSEQQNESNYRVLSERHSSDSSEEENTSDSGSDDDSGNYGDSENTEFENSGRSMDPSESDAGNPSLPTKQTSSRRRKMIVTFKEPSLGSKRNGSKKTDPEENSKHLPATPEDGHQSSSSSSSDSSSSESKNKKKSQRHKNDAPAKKTRRRKPSSSMDGEEKRMFDKLQKDDTHNKLRHLQTR